MSKKNKKGKKYVVYPIEIFYLVVILCLVFLLPKFVSWGIDMIFSESIDMKKVIEIDIEESTVNKKGFLIDQKLMVQSGDLLICFDIDGKELWKRNLNSDNTQIIKWEKNYIIADLDYGRLALVNDKNEILKEISLQYKVEEIVTSKDKLYLLIEDENKIVILNNNLEQNSEIVQEYRDILKISSDYDSSELIVFLSTIKNQKLETLCIVYNKNGEIIASLDLNKSLVFNVFSDNNIVIVTDDKFSTYASPIKPIAELSYIGTLTDVDFNNSKIYSITTATEANISEKKLSVYNLGLEKLNTMKLPETSSLVAAGEKFLLTASENRVSLMNSNLKVLQELNLSINIEEIEWISKYAFYVVGDNKLIIYSGK